MLENIGSYLRMSTYSLYVVSCHLPRLETHHLRQIIGNQSTPPNYHIYTLPEQIDGKNGCQEGTNNSNKDQQLVHGS
jgi:hypothetical protein